MAIAIYPLKTKMQKTHRIACVPKYVTMDYNASTLPNMYNIRLYHMYIACHMCCGDGYLLRRTTFSYTMLPLVSHMVSFSRTPFSHLEIYVQHRDCLHNFQKIRVSTTVNTQTHTHNNTVKHRHTISRTRWQRIYVLM